MLLKIQIRKRVIHYVVHQYRVRNHNGVCYSYYDQWWSDITFLIFFKLQIFDSTNTDTDISYYFFWYIQFKVILMKFYATIVSAINEKELFFEIHWKLPTLQMYLPGTKTDRQQKFHKIKLHENCAPISDILKASNIYRL